MENILLGAMVYVCDEHDFVANKRKVLLYAICLILTVLTVEAIESKHQCNYNHVGEYKITFRIPCAGIIAPPLQLRVLFISL